VARGHEDAARVAREAEKAQHEGGGPAVEDLNVPAGDARPARDDGVEDTVTVDVTDRHADIALEARRKSANRSGGEETSQNVRGPEGLQHRRGSRDCDRSILADNDLDRRRRGQTFDTRERELLSVGEAVEATLGGGSLSIRHAFELGQLGPLQEQAQEEAPEAARVPRAGPGGRRPAPPDQGGAAP